jgi:hypothetical protein
MQLNDIVLFINQQPVHHLPFQNVLTLLRTVPHPLWITFAAPTSFIVQHYDTTNGIRPPTPKKSKMKTMQIYTGTKIFSNKTDYQIKVTSITKQCSSPFNALVTIDATPITNNMSLLVAMEHQIKCTVDDIKRSLQEIGLTISFKELMVLDEKETVHLYLTQVVKTLYIDDTDNTMKLKSKNIMNTNTSKNSDNGENDNSENDENELLELVSEELIESSRSSSPIALPIVKEDEKEDNKEGERNGKRGSATGIGSNDVEVDWRRAIGGVVTQAPFNNITTPQAKQTINTKQKQAHHLQAKEEAKEEEKHTLLATIVDIHDVNANQCPLYRIQLLQTYENQFIATYHTISHKNLQTKGYIFINQFSRLKNGKHGHAYTLGKNIVARFDRIIEINNTPV